MQISDKTNLLIFFLLLLFSFLLYSNTLSNQFVFDDWDLIVHNPLIQNLNNIPHFFEKDIYDIPGQNYIKGNYRPLLSLFLAFDYRFWGLDKLYGYHLTAIILHAICAFLVFLIVRLLLNSPLAELFSSFLFLSFPVSSFVIAYKSGKMEAILGVFFLSSFYFFAKHIKQKLKHQKFYLSSLLFLIMALLVKETAVILPVLFLLFEILNNSKVNFKKYLPVALILAVYFLIRLSLYGTPGLVSLPHVKDFHNFPITQNYYYQVLTSFNIIGHYLKLLVMPWPLRADYFFDISKSLFEPGVITSLSSILFLFIAAWKSKNKHPLVSFAIAWFFIVLLPVSNLIFIGNLIAENYLYLACVGLFIMLGRLFDYLICSQKKKIALMVFIALFITYSSLTISRNFTWSNELRLWTDTVIKSPKSARAHLNLGKEYLEISLTGEAIEQFNIAAELVPDYELAFHNLGVAYLNLNKPNAAAEYFIRALEINPELIPALNNLGACYYLMGDFKKAKKCFKKIIIIDPTNQNAQLNLDLLNPKK